MGRGSFRPTTESLGTVFKANIQVSDDGRSRRFAREATLAVEGSGEHSITAWIVADEYGTYAVAVRGMGLDAQGTAKLESEPHLGLLWSENGDAHVAFTLFVSHESHGCAASRRRIQLLGLGSWRCNLRTAARLSVRLSDRVRASAWRMSSRWLPGGASSRPA